MISPHLPYCRCEACVTVLHQDIRSKMRREARLHRARLYAAQAIAIVDTLLLDYAGEIEGARSVLTKTRKGLTDTFDQIVCNSKKEG